VTRREAQSYAEKRGRGRKEGERRKRGKRGNNLYAIDSKS
jgi:hypothetical protein